MRSGHTRYVAVQSWIQANGRYYSFKQEYDSAIIWVVYEPHLEHAFSVINNVSTKVSYSAYILSSFMSEKV